MNYPSICHSFASKNPIQSQAASLSPQQLPGPQQLLVAAGHGVAQSEAAALLQQCSVPVEEAMMPPGKGLPPGGFKKSHKKDNKKPWWNHC
jgi:hypothetical protein